MIFFLLEVGPLDVAIFTSFWKNKQYLQAI